MQPLLLAGLVAVILTTRINVKKAGGNSPRFGLRLDIFGWKRTFGRPSDS